MTFASDDFDRTLVEECLWKVEGLRDNERARDICKDAIASARKHMADGVQKPVALRRKVMRDLRDKYKSIILIAILTAVIHFIVVRLLERLFPKGE